MQILEAQKTAWVVSISFFQMFLVLDFFLAKNAAILGMTRESIANHPNWIDGN
jgi:hypothetical protein